MVASQQYLRDPINCFWDGGGVPKSMKGDHKALDTHCWIRSTFTARSRSTVDTMPYPGVVNPYIGDELKYHTYYQWVCFTLFFQAMLFYMPHYLWKMWEGGKCQMLVMDMQSPVTPAAKRRDQQKRITEYFSASLHHHSLYAGRFFRCEMLNFVNVLAQIFFTDLFLGYEFTTYGSRVVQYAMGQEYDPDPKELVFPKTTKCTFHKYGASGTVEHIDGICMLPINILNEKIYVIMWFWFIMLAALSGLMLLYRVALMIPRVRLQVLLMRAKLAPSDQVAIVGRKCQVSDWFLLQRMGNNMDSIAFKELIRMLANCFKGRDMDV